MYEYMGKVHWIKGCKFGVAANDSKVPVEYLFATEQQALAFIERKNTPAANAESHVPMPADGTHD